jgi:hypothetical protein
MTIPPIPLRPMVWQPWEHGIARANSAFGEYYCWPGYFRPPGQQAGIPADDPQAAAEADRSARIAAELDPARLTQWAAGVLLAEMMKAPQELATVRRWERAFREMHGDSGEWFGVAGFLRALAGEAGQ